jgi:hydroxymethylglutaryl-CoA synthase
LKKFCEWNGQNWSKIEAVVGRSFRIADQHESVYTMAANAVLRLILNYDIDPQQVGMLALGTESSTDNAAGAVIVRGMVDDALLRLGRKPLARNCEVPEFKHACLGGMYALKAAVRYLKADGAGRLAIVVAGDMAEYERGSTGEPTQGAGAVAMLIDEKSELFSVDLSKCGSSSAYREVDFRKPFRRHLAQGSLENTTKLHDFPVFNGKYSTTCYVEATVAAMDDLLNRLELGGLNFFDSLSTALFHRPYHKMPVQGLSTLYVYALARSTERTDELAALCTAANVDIAAVREEAKQSKDGLSRVRADSHDLDIIPNITACVRALRKTPAYEAQILPTLKLGSSRMMELGNLYTASLPAWIAAAFEAAADPTNPESLEAGQSILLMGYGSGDAAEAMVVTVSPNYQDAAARIGFQAALADAVDLEQEQYVALHDHGHANDLTYSANGFVIDRIGEASSPQFSDLGIEYYRFIDNELLAATTVERARTA